MLVVALQLRNHSVTLVVVALGYDSRCNNQTRNKQTERGTRKMAQGEFTKEEAGEVAVAVEEIWSALSKRKQAEYLGHLNDILLFLTAVIRRAPKESKR